MTNNRPQQGFALIALTALFFLWGFITCLNDLLIPHLKAVFTLSYSQAMLVQFCFFTAYAVVSIPAGRWLARAGYPRGIVAGLSVAGGGCLLFYPAAAQQSYALFLLAFFILAAGITVLQVAANPYVAVLGDAATASRRLTLTQAFNSLGTTLAPLLATRWLFSSEASATAGATAVQQPYLLLAGALLGLALLFARLPLPQVMADAAAPVTVLALRQQPRLMVGIVAIFVYVGAEVAIGSFLISFIGDASVAALPPAEAGHYVALYWGGALLGRFMGVALMRWLQPARLLMLHALLAVALLLAAMTLHGVLAMWSLLAVGLCNSILFPTIFSLALRGLGAATSQGAGYLCAAIVGGAVVPLLQGVLADDWGLRLALGLPVLCYGMIAVFGWLCLRWDTTNADDACRF